MSRDPTQRIAHFLEAIERCRRYISDSDQLEMAEDAIERNLQIIGEAVNHLPTEITGAHPEIAWRRSEASATSSYMSISASMST